MYVTPTRRCLDFTSKVGVLSYKVNWYRNYLQVYTVVTVFTRHVCTFRNTKKRIFCCLPTHSNNLIFTQVLIKKHEVEAVLSTWDKTCLSTFYYFSGSALSNWSRITGSCFSVGLSYGLKAIFPHAYDTVFQIQLTSKVFRITEIFGMLYIYIFVISFHSVSTAQWTIQQS